MSFVRKAVKFSLKDIGSNVIDQLSSDIYSGPSSIIRELAKNAYDAYLPVAQDELDDEGLSREIVISRDRDAKGIGRLMIADNGIGQTFQDLKANVQISISKKAVEIENATGFRGLGSWASLGAGSKIIITSSKKGQARQSRLTLDVRAIYGIMGPDKTLDEVLNNEKCITFEEEADFRGGSHGTTVEIICDGPPSKVGRYELNRLFDFTDPNDTTLREVLMESCPIPFSSDGGSYEKIHEIYRQIGYVPTKISLNGDELLKRLPPELNHLEVSEFKIGPAIAARWWTASNPKTSAVITQINGQKHSISGPGIQLMKLNVPIGPKNLFSDGIRANIPQWYVGEVHIELPDVLPDAGGQGLRAGTAREVFVEKMAEFYADLEDKAEKKSQRLSMEKTLKKGVEAAKQLNMNQLSEADRAHAKSAVAKAVQVISETSVTGPPSTVTARRQKEAAKDPNVRKIRSEARKLFQDEGYLDQFADKSKGKKGARKAKTVKQAASTSVDQQTISFPDLQARLGQAVPQLLALGFTPDQVDKVFQVINECVIGDS